MVVLITGASHTGKTVLSQRLLEKCKFPYLSIDHLKMGLIRSKQTNLTPEDDEELTEYLWNILREIIKTAIENNQNLIIEGSYIPFNWKDDFDEEYIEHIKYCCLIMSENYIKNNFDSVLKYANIIEKRLDNSAYTIESILEDNAKFLSHANQYNSDYILIDDKYDIDIETCFADIHRKGDEHILF